jgi:hypothetical protein
MHTTYLKWSISRMMKAGVMRPVYVYTTPRALAADKSCVYVATNGSNSGSAVRQQLVQL